MYTLYHCPDVPKIVREEFRSICEDPEIVRKRRSFQPLDEDDNQKIDRALEIGRIYKSIVARYIMPKIRGYYEAARNHLHKAFRCLPNPNNDRRNRHYKHVLRMSLDSMWNRLFGIQTAFRL